MRVIVWWCIAGVASGFQNIMPFWYPIMPVEAFREKKMHLCHLGDAPLVVYMKNETSIIAHSDVCPHMGGSFAKGGWLNEEGSIVCPYHGFEYNEGRFMGLPSSQTRALKPSPYGALRVFPVMVLNDYVYVLPAPVKNIAAPDPYFPPEHDDPDFRVIRGTRLMECGFDSLVENLLDMLHISFVHSFGNADIPIPTNVAYEKTGEFSGKTRFNYESNEATISRQVGGTASVAVENEFFLPGTTLTRVRAGGVVKTVFTQSVPISANRTMLLWSIYRNFWKDPYFPEFDRIGDALLRVFMERTLDEDASILARAYPEGRNGFLTKYDITIRKYRELRNRFPTE